MGENSWKAGRDNSWTTKENEESVRVKSSHCILENTSIELIIISVRQVLQKWQWFITRPVPHESRKSKEGGETILPMTGAKTFMGGIHVDGLL